MEALALRYGSLTAHDSGDHDQSTCGKLNLTVSGNNTHILEVGSPSFGRDSEGLLTNARPRTEFVIAGDWAIADFDRHANVTRYASVTSPDDDANSDEDPTFSARWLLDMSASCHWQAWTFTVGGDSLTNRHPTTSALNNAYEDRADGLPYPRCRLRLQPTLLVRQGQ